MFWLASPSAFADTALDKVIQEFLGRTFVTAALLSDDEVVKFGIWDFNPNDVVDLESEGFGSEESSRLRESLKQISVPFRWRISEEGSADAFSIAMKVAFLEYQEDLQLVPSDESRLDRSTEQVLSAGGGFGYTKRIDQHWELVLESYLTWMRYDSDVDFNTTQSRTIQPVFDGLLTNIETEFLMAEPAVGVNYNWARNSIRYQAFSKYHYLAGRYFSADIRAHEATAAAWYWSNGVGFKKPIVSDAGAHHALWFRLTRTDMGGDLDGVLGENHYYEAGIAWLVDAPKRIRLLDNVGLGINLNYGSELQGGTLILLYNVEGFR